MRGHGEQQVETSAERPLAGVVADFFERKRCSGPWRQIGLDEVIHGLAEEVREGFHGPQAWVVLLAAQKFGEVARADPCLLGCIDGLDDFEVGVAATIRRSALIEQPAELLSEVRRQRFPLLATLVPTGC